MTEPDYKIEELFNAKMLKQEYPTVNRVEVISSEGEEIIWDVWDECSKVQVRFQNYGETLKVFFIKEEPK
jgi:hypothetical protein